MQCSYCFEVSKPQVCISEIAVTVCPCLIRCYLTFLASVSISVPELWGCAVMFPLLKTERWEQLALNGRIHHHHQVLQGNIGTTENSLTVSSSEVEVCPLLTYKWKYIKQQNPPKKCLAYNRTKSGSKALVSVGIWDIKSLWQQLNNSCIHYCAIHCTSTVCPSHPSLHFLSFPP